MKSIVNFAAASLLLIPALSADTKVKMADLPPAVQTAVKEQTKTATLVGLSKETENGKTTYEAETTVNGKSRDVSFDKTGAIVAVEQEVDLDSIPGCRESRYSEEDRHWHAEESGIRDGRENYQL